MGGNVLAGVWLNLSFWYKREEKTRFAVYVTMVGLVFTIIFNLLLLPRWGYYGGAWARLIAESAMVVVSYYLNRRYFPTPYDLKRIAEYVVLGVGLYFVSEAAISTLSLQGAMLYALNLCLFFLYVIYAVRRENINLEALIRSVLKRKR